MKIQHLAPGLSVSEQILPEQLAEVKAAGFRAIICNRPDGEGNDQPLFAEIERAARAAGIDAHYLPAESGKVTDEQGAAFGQLLAALPKPVLAYCRTGMRSTTMWALSQSGQQPLPQIVDAAKKAGFDMKGVVRRIANEGRTPVDAVEVTHTVVIIGGGAAGIATASSLLARDPDLDIAIIDPADALLPAGLDPGRLRRVRCRPDRPHDGIDDSGMACTGSRPRSPQFEPDGNAVILDGCRVVIPAAGGARLKLDWHAIDGLSETLGRNGVTRITCTTWPLTPGNWCAAPAAGAPSSRKPPMPIKCAGAPQKAMYLSADHWKRSGVLDRIKIEFCSAGAVLFGVAAYVPALMEYVKAYGIDLNFGYNLTAVDGPARTATFTRVNPDGSKRYRRPPVRPAARCRRRCARFHPGQPAGRCRRLGRCRSRHLAPQDVGQYPRPGRRDQYQQRQDCRRRPQAGPGGCPQCAGGDGS
jgi:sulfide:quinone oxidoreductase